MVVVDCKVLKEAGVPGCVALGRADELKVLAGELPPLLLGPMEAPTSSILEKDMCRALAAKGEG